MITGGAAGIGLAVAQRSRRAAQPSPLWDRDARGAREGRQRRCRRHADVRARRCRRRRGRARRRRHVRDALGRIDVLVCSAGITGPNVSTWEYPVDRVAPGDRRQPQRPLLLQSRRRSRRCSKNDYGRIVNIASVAGKEGNPNASAYSTSKAARDRPHQVARQGAREDRHPRQLRDARGGAHGDLRPDDAAAHRLHAVEDSDGPLRHRRRDRRARRAGSRARIARSRPARCSTSRAAARRTGTRAAPSPHRGWTPQRGGLDLRHAQARATRGRHLLAEHDLADVLRRFHQRVRGGRLGEREHAVDDRLHARRPRAAARLSRAANSRSPPCARSGSRAASSR